MSRLDRYLGHGDNFAAAAAKLCDWHGRDQTGGSPDIALKGGNM